MDSEKRKQLIDVIGLVGLIASLVFVGIQLRQTSKIAYSELDASMLAMRVETNNAINENAEIWVRGCKGDSLSPTEKVVFTNLVANRNNLWFIEYRHAGELGRPEIADGILHDWAAFLYRNPGARAAWDQREKVLDYYRNILIDGGNKWSFWKEMIEADLAKLEAGLNK